MRRSVLCVVGCGLGLAAWGCRSEPAPSARSEPLATVPSGPTSASARGAIATLQRELQATRLPVPARPRHLPRLAFGAGALARLRDRDVQILDERTLSEVATITLEQPRAVLRLADGAFLAIGARGLARWESGAPVRSWSEGLIVFPGAELYPDARQADVFWVFEPDVAPPRLRSYRLGITTFSGVLLPEQTIELSSPTGGTFGVTREGVWLYVTPGRAERLAPSGLRLPGLNLGRAPVPTWVFPSRRLDQSTWLDETGGLTRALVSPTFKALGSSRQPGSPYVADVGDEGRLLAIVCSTAPGPHFELVLVDSELGLLGRAALPSERPSGESDWVQVVTRNQEVAVAPRAPRVAVGGPERLAIFDRDARLILSIPIR